MGRDLFEILGLKPKNEKPVISHGRDYDPSDQGARGEYHIVNTGDPLGDTEEQQSPIPVAKKEEEDESESVPV